MFERLFGPSEEAQMAYLQKRVILTLVLVAIDVILLILGGGFGLSYIACYIWGWGVMKALFGITTIGAIFSRNAVIAAIFIVAYLIIGAICGAFCLFLGVGRFIYLKVKYEQKKR